MLNYVVGRMSMGGCKTIILVGIILLVTSCSYAQQKKVKMIVTGYCSCPKCCGKNAQGITASGHRIQRGDKFAAAPKHMKFDTSINVPGYNKGKAIKVKDRGGKIKNQRLDLYFENHKLAQAWGIKTLDVLVGLIS